METVELGSHRLPVVPQRHARLKHSLSPEDLQAILSAEYAAHAWRILCVLIPELPKQMTEWEFNGFETEEAWRADAYDPEKDQSPTVDQIVGAVETCIQVNGGARLGKLLGLVQTAGQLAEAQKTSGNSTPASPASPGSDGASASASTGASSPTTTES